jgi:hypothetical protein
VPLPIESDLDQARYGAACETWMEEIRAIAANSLTGQIFKGAVQNGHGTLARDDQNQIVIVSPTRDFSTVVDRSLRGTSDLIDYHRWVSSIAVKQLPTKFEVREGQDHAGDKELEGTLRALHAREAEDALALTKASDKKLDERPASMAAAYFDINMKIRREQSLHFERERARYIEEHREAKQLAEQMEKDEKEKQKRAGHGFESKFYP